MRCASLCKREWRRGKRSEEESQKYGGGVRRGVPKKG